MIIRNSAIKSLLPKVFLILGLGSIYLATIAPGLTWANNGADGGDLISAAATWGVAHPPGYPVYLLIARIFQFLPVGSIAFRTNLLSAICTVLAATILYEIVVRSFVSLKEKWLAGLVTAFAFGLSQLVWSQAVITEIYALQELLIVLLLYLLLLGKNHTNLNPKVVDSLLGLIFGLAFSNHLTALILLPAVLLVDIVSYHPVGNHPLRARYIHQAWRMGWSVQWGPLIRRCIWILIGISVFLSLFIRANTGSPVNWGNPSTIKNFIWVISGKIYGNYLFDFPYSFFSIKLATWGKIFLNQVGLIGLLIAIFGLIWNWSKSIRFSAVTSWMVFTFWTFSFFYNSIDSYVYLIFAIIAISLWLGWGVASIITITNLYQRWLGVVAGILVIGYLIGTGWQTWPKVDASKDFRAEDFGHRVISIAPSESIIFTDGDKDAFALWYFHYVLEKRPDIAVIVTNLLPYDWYRETLRSTYPGLKIPLVENDSWKATILQVNPNRPVCNTIVIEEAAISCSK